MADSETKVHPKIERWMKSVGGPAGVSAKAWRLELDEGSRRKVIAGIRQAASPYPSYFVLIVLSTLIAGFGLVSNSTATVIGAMIVAPLMGPILGLALAFVQGNKRLFRTALFAESAGVVLVVLTGMSVAWLVGPSHVDFNGSEIMGRVNPTLYDLLIGLAAGLAGAYCTANPRLSSSVAGVAIAVALVPPLTVTGISVAGALVGNCSWSFALGSFMLFMANFLTIEAAAAGVFLWAGLGKREVALSEEMKAPLIVNAILLILTTTFLGFQLSKMLELRAAKGQSRKVLLSELSQVPGATLTALDVAENRGERRLEATIASRQPLTPEIVAELEDAVNDDLETPVRLVVRAVASSYITSTGLLYEPPDAPPDPQQLFLAKLEGSINRALQSFPGTELSEFRQLSGLADENVRLELSLTSPYVFEPELVGRLESELSRSLDGRRVEATVKTILSNNASSECFLQHAAPETRSKEEVVRLEQRDARHLLARESLEKMVDAEDSVTLEGAIELEEFIGEGGRPLMRLRVRVVCPERLEMSTIGDWEQSIEKALTSADYQPDVVLSVLQTQGAALTYGGSKPEIALSKLEAAMEAKVEALVGREKGAQLTHFDFLSTPTPSVSIIVYSDKVLDPKVVKRWETSLRKVAAKPVELEVDNRVGALL